MLESTRVFYLCVMSRSMNLHSPDASYTAVDMQSLYSTVLEVTIRDEKTNLDNILGM